MRSPNFWASRQSKGRFLWAMAWVALRLLGPSDASRPIIAAETTNAAPSTDANLADLSLQDLLQVRYGKVYSASRQEQTVEEEPASVNLVSAEESLCVTRRGTPMPFAFHRGLGKRAAG